MRAILSFVGGLLVAALLVGLWFFGAEKRYLGLRISVFSFNTIVLVGSTIGLLALLHLILRRQLEIRKT